MPDDALWKNAQTANGQVYLCDSVFIYLTNGQQRKTIYLRDAITEYDDWLNMEKLILSYDDSGNILTKFRRLGILV